MDYFTLDNLSRNHGGWRLLRSEHAPLVAGFLHRAFVEPNVRVMGRADLAELLEDELFALRDSLGEKVFPRTALQYLDDWAADEKGWLRKFYPHGSDEPHYDLTPSTEKAIAWLTSLTERSFVGTESRLLTLFELLRQMSEGTETDPAERLRELERRRDGIEDEMERVRRGEVPLMDGTALKDRFQQFVMTARELLADFREVEQNFRTLDREVRERIALWEGTKGELLEEVMGRRDAITGSDQGRSFQAFWDFLMSPERQESFAVMLERVLGLKPVLEMGPDERLHRVHYDWLDAGEHTQRMVARLSRELRRFLDDQAWLENRRIMDLLHGIEGRALAVRNAAPKGDFTEIAGIGAEVSLPMERPLFEPTVRTLVSDVVVEGGDEDVDAAALFSTVYVDRGELLRHIERCLKSRGQISLAELVELRPLERGLAELLTYLQLAEDEVPAVVDDTETDSVSWEAEEGTSRRASFPRVLFVRRS